MTRQIQDACIVSAVRSPVGKAPKGMFRNTRPDDLLAHVLRGAVAAAPGVDPKRIDDAIIGCAMPEGEQGMNVARIGVLLAGLPNTVSAMTINRFCSSGLQAIALGAERIASGQAEAVVAGGVEHRQNAQITQAQRGLEGDGRERQFLRFFLGLQRRQRVFLVPPHHRVSYRSCRRHAPRAGRGAHLNPAGAAVPPENGRGRDAVRNFSIN